MTAERKVTVTPIAVSIHTSGRDPLLDDCAYRLEVTDEGAGPFFLLTGDEDGEDGTRRTIRLDPEDIEAIAAAAKQLLKTYHTVADKA